MGLSDIFLQGSGSASEHADSTHSSATLNRK